jgi:gentisate 1,2-dioxygenase
MKRIIVLDDYQQVALSSANWGILAGRAEIVVSNERVADRDNLIRLLSGFHGVIVNRERTALTAEIIDALPGLEFIGTSGMRNSAIDVAAAVRRGVLVSGTRTLGYPTVELTWGLILGLLRHIPAEHAAMKVGKWQSTVGRGVSGKVLGIAGFGRIGRDVARAGAAFGMRVLACSRSLSAEQAKAAGVEVVSKPDLFRRSDILTLHLQLNDATLKWVGAEELALMKSEAVLVNTARGPLIDESALTRALQSRTIAGAALDTFEHEPLPSEHPFRVLDNVLLTPHLGYVTAENYAISFGEIVENVVAWLDGTPIRIIGGSSGASNLASQTAQKVEQPSAKQLMEEANREASLLHIWLRTQANAPAQRPWFSAGIDAPASSAVQGRVGLGQIKAQPHRWRWREIEPYLLRIARIARSAEGSPIEFADRQQFLLVNPGMSERLQVASTIRCAVSIYNPRDVAPVHIHTPNASRTILSERGGYTTVDGEKCIAERGDLILTPNGTWHDHGNDGDGPVMWADVLDWPLLEYLDCIWLDDRTPPGLTEGNGRVQRTSRRANYSQTVYGHGGIVPSHLTHSRGIGVSVSPMVHYRGAVVRAALADLKADDGDPYEGISLRFTNPTTGGPVFPTLEYSAQLLRPGEETWMKRETSNTLYFVMEGSGATEVDGKSFDWDTNDIFVVPNFAWRRHVANSGRDVLLYAVSDRPLFEKIGQYRAQGRSAGGSITELANS